MLMIDEVAQELFDIVYDSEHKDVAIYMSYEYWSLCNHEAKGQANIYAREFATLNTIGGYPVYKVIDHNNSSHPHTGL